MIGIIVVTVLIFAGLAFAIIKAPAGPSNGGVEEQHSFHDANNPFQGPADAKVVVRLFGDYQCPACRVAEGATQYAINTYKDRVKFVWNDFPLTTIHPNARPASNAARCAEEQGKFWEYHDMLYDKQTDWSHERSPQAKFNDYAASLGLNKDTFSSCLSSRTHDGKIADDISEGNRNRVDRTPTVFINNRRFFALTPAEWDKAIQEQLLTGN